MGRGLDPGFHMATEALPLLRQVLRARYRPQALATAGWQGAARWLATAEQLPHDLSRLLRNARPRAACRWASSWPTSSAWATRSTAPPTGWRWRW
jgi:predicted unusual protein kinase regulating ubiquinone biosynthesis (AarF/ABC1/UbiB family)